MIQHQTSNSCGNYNYNAFLYSDISYSAHFHKNYELIYVLKGKVELSVNGKSGVLKPGEMILISPYAVHSFAVDGKSKIWVGVFSEDFVLSFSKANSQISYSKFKCGLKQEAFLKEHLFFQGQPELYLAKSCLYLVCSECLKHAVAFDMKSSDEFRNRVIAFISENLSDEITLGSTAAALGYEYHYFSALFHRCFNMHFKEFINMFRFEFACEMLLHTKADIAFLAVECGFQSIRNFNRIFKKFSGHTPTEYRKQLQSED